MTNSTTISITFKDQEGIFFEVPSSTDENVIYDVHYFFNAVNDTNYVTPEEKEKSKWRCTCQGNWYGHKCKHIKACETLLAEVME